MITLVKVYSSPHLITLSPYIFLANTIRFIGINESVMPNHIGFLNGSVDSGTLPLISGHFLVGYALAHAPPGWKNIISHFDFVAMTVEITEWVATAIEGLV